MRYTICFIFILCGSLAQALAPQPRTAFLAQTEQTLRVELVQLNRQMTLASEPGEIDEETAQIRLKETLKLLTPKEQALIFFNLLDSQTLDPLDLLQIHSWSFWEDLLASDELLKSILFKLIALRGPLIFSRLETTIPYFRRHSSPHASGTYIILKPYFEQAILTLSILAEVIPWQTKHFLAHSLLNHTLTPLSARTIEAILKRGSLRDKEHGSLKAFSFQPGGNVWDNAAQQLMDQLSGKPFKVRFKPLSFKTQAAPATPRKRDLPASALVDASGQLTTSLKASGFEVVHILGRTIVLKVPGHSNYLALKLMNGKRGETAQDLDLESQTMSFVSSLKAFPFSLTPVITDDGKRLIRLPLLFLKLFKNLDLDSFTIDSKGATAFAYWAPPSAFVYLDQISDDGLFQSSAIKIMSSLGSMMALGVIQTECAAFHHDTAHSRTHRWMVDVLPTWSYRFGSGVLGRVLSQSSFSNFRSDGLLMDYGSVFLWDEAKDSFNQKMSHEISFNYAHLFNEDAFYLTDFIGQYFLSWSLITARRMACYSASKISFANLLEQGLIAFTASLLNISSKDAQDFVHRFFPHSQFKWLATQLQYFTSEQSVHDLVNHSVPKDILGLAQDCPLDFPHFPSLLDIQTKFSLEQPSGLFPRGWAAIIILDGDRKPIGVRHLGWMSSLHRASLRKLKEQLKLTSLNGPFALYDFDEERLDSDVILTVSSEEPNLEAKLDGAFETLKFDFLDSGPVNGAFPLTALSLLNYRFAPALVQRFAYTSEEFSETEKHLSFLKHRVLTSFSSREFSEMIQWIDVLYIRGSRLPLPVLNNFFIWLSEFLELTWKQKNDIDPELVFAYFDEATNLIRFLYDYHRDQFRDKSKRAEFNRLNDLLVRYHQTPNAPLFHNLGLLSNTNLLQSADHFGRIQLQSGRLVLTHHSFLNPTQETLFHRAIEQWQEALLTHEAFLKHIFKLPPGGSILDLFDGISLIIDPAMKHLARFKDRTLYLNSFWLNQLQDTPEFTTLLFMDVFLGEGLFHLYNQTLAKTSSHPLPSIEKNILTLRLYLLKRSGWTKDFLDNYLLCFGEHNFQSTIIAGQRLDYPQFLHYLWQAVEENVTTTPRDFNSLFSDLSHTPTSLGVTLEELSLAYVDQFA